MLTGLDWPWLIATASSVPEAPEGHDPAQPAGLMTPGFQTTVSTCGTPRVNRTEPAGAGRHAAESHTTWPSWVTTTWTEPAPYVSVQAAVPVETA